MRVSPAARSAAASAMKAANDGLKASSQRM
jgi:hypothetical protein